jgi:hypothetical protein
MASVNTGRTNDEVEASPAGTWSSTALWNAPDADELLALDARWEQPKREGLARLDYTHNAINKTLVARFSVRPEAVVKRDQPGRLRARSAISGA